MTDGAIATGVDAATNKSATPTPPTDRNPNSCSPDDLIELIRAVKFANTDMSMRQTFHEISVTMADSDPSYAFLKDVKLNDVKKVWKKALKGGSTETTGPSRKKEPTPRAEAAATKKSADEPIVPAEGVVKFYTVGDGSARTLAEDYANRRAREAVAAGRRRGEDAAEEGKSDRAHFFLYVPADRSGSRPHQALMNFQDNQRGGKGKGKSKSKKKDAQSSRRSCDGKGIFKIQLAALPPGMEDVPTPMLLYNSDRTAKTFLHPPSSADDEDDDGEYFKIRKMINDNGTSGALGATGGQKAYFYGIITKTKSGPDVVSIDIQSGLVPHQTW